MTLSEQIKKKFIRLSKGQRKVAQFILDNPTVIATQVAAEVGRLAGVSESTVIRFCYAMDFSGFSELQQSIKDQLVESGSVLEVARKSALESTAKNNSSMNKDLEDISNIMKKIPSKQLTLAAQLLHNAQKIHILDFNHNTPVTTWLHTQLHKLKSEVHLHTHMTASTLTTEDQQSAIIVLLDSSKQPDKNALFERFTDCQAQVVAFAYEQDAIHHSAIDVLFTLPSQKDEEVECPIALLSMLRAIVSSMVNLDEVGYKEYMQKQLEPLRVLV